MEWTDDAFVLSAKPHGESSAVVNLLTRDHGRCAGLVRGASGKAARGLWQTGNLVQVAWKARLSEHLGNLSGELLHPHAAELMTDPLRLTGLSAACAMAEASLPEREPHQAMFEATMALVTAFDSESWPTVYVHWELALLREMGFGLDLSACAATGATTGLAYVSPKSGRAVSAAAGAPWHDKMLILPRFLTEGGEGDAQALRDALATTGFFLDRHVFAPHRRQMPAARSRLVDRLGS